MLLDFGDEFRKSSYRPRADQVHGMDAEHAIAFKLRFAEELVRRAFVRETRIRLEIFVNIARFVAVAGRLDVDDQAIWRIFAVDVLITNSSEGGMATALLSWSFVIAAVDPDIVELDRNPKVDSDFPHRIAEIGKGAFRVLPGIADHDKMAATQDHFV